jgi:hypothetical protein
MNMKPKFLCKTIPVFALGLSLVLAGCPSDILDKGLLTDSDSTFDTEESAGGAEKKPGDGKQPAGSGALPGIVVQDVFNAVLNNDTPLTVSIKNTTGRTVIPTITGAPAGFNYLQWAILKDDPEDAPVAALDVVGVAPALSSICPVVVPLGIGTVTVTVRNCTIDGVPGTLTASFTVEVVAAEEGPGMAGGGSPFSDGTGSVTIQFWTNNNDALLTNTAWANLSRSGNGFPKSLLIEGITTAGYSGYQWSLNGADIPGAAGTAATYPFDSVSKGNGTYNVGLRVKKGNEWHSTNIMITVTD